MESCQHTLLSVFHKVSPQWNVSRIHRVFKGVLSALVFIHAKNYVHRDIKLSNLLVANGDCVKICDFGLVAQTGTPLTNYCGTVSYLPPESIQHLITTVHGCLDVWSYGCCVYTFLAGAQPFLQKVLEDTVNRIRLGLYEQSVEIMAKPGGQQLMRLLARVFEPKYELRITAEDLLADPFFSQEFNTNETVHVNILFKIYTFNDMFLLIDRPDDPANEFTQSSHMQSPSPSSYANTASLKVLHIEKERSGQ